MKENLIFNNFYAYTKQFLKTKNRAVENHQQARFFKSFKSTIETIAHLCLLLYM